MTWTRLNHAPADPPVPRRGERDGDRPPELQVMNALGPLAKGLAFLMGKQPEEERYPRGFLGIEWAETRDGLSGQTTVRISRVVEGSPAAKAGIQTGDRVIRARGQSVTSLKAARTALSAIQAGNPVELILGRGDEKSKARHLTVTITAGEGF